MKKLLLVLSITALSNIAGAATLANIAGSFKATSTEFSVLNIVTISAQGDVKLTEQSAYGRLECTGKGTLRADILSSSLKCEDGQTFNQRINLKNVKNFNKFSANVYSSLYGQEVELNFERIK